MVRAASFLLASVIALSATALPTPDVECDGDDSATAITAAQLIQIDPKTASCAGAPFPDECADAARAAPAISASFKKYGITAPGEQAALIAIMDMESEGFKYSKNHYSGATGKPNPGQGTRNMQMPEWNVKYANDVLGAAASAAVTAGGDTLTAALNKDDAISFGSAAWFLTKGNVGDGKCTKEIRDGLATGTEAGWSLYITQCVGTEVVDARKDPWLAAKKVLGVA